MDTEMEYLQINNIKQEVEPTSASDANENSNNNQAAPDSVENKVSGSVLWMPLEQNFTPLPSCVDNKCLGSFLTIIRGTFPSFI